MKRIASAGLLFGLLAIGLAPVACGESGGQSESDAGAGGTGPSTGGAAANSSGGAGGRASATGGSGGAVNASGGTSGGAAGATGGTAGAASASGGNSGAAGTAGTGGGKGGAAGGTVGSGGAGGHAGSGGSGTGTGGAAGKTGSGGAAGAAGAGAGGTGGTSTCTISGVVYQNGAVDPANACLKCASTQTTTAWSPVAGGTSCGTGQACFSGACLRTCTLSNGGVYGEGQMASCGVCNPDVSTTTLTPVPEGSTCVAGSTGGTAAVCHVGACVHGCFIGGAFVGDGADNSANVCQYCDPPTSISAWTSRPNCGGSCPAPAIAPTLFTYTNPPPGEIVYDTLRAQVVAFGSTGTSIWDGATWVQLNTSAIPSVAVSLGLLPPPVYDSVRDRAVAFGVTGTSTGTYTNTTWEWDEQSWMSVTPTDLIPRTRIGHAMVFDASLGRTVTFGGSSRDGTVSTLTDTWAWDGANWTRLVPSTSAAPPDVGPMGYDSGRTRSVLLVGGTTVNAGSMQYTLPLSTWELAGSTWSQVRTDNVTIYSQTWSAVAAYDSSRQHVVRLFQRTATINAPASVTMDEWNGTAWTTVPTPGFVIPVGAGNPVYDSARRRLVFRANSTTGNGLTSMYEIGFEPLPDRAPTAAAIPAQIVFAHDTLTFTAQASDPDQNPVTFSATGLPSGASMTTGGVFTWTPTESQTGNYTVSVTASDGCLTGSTSVAITVYWVTYPFPQGTLSVTGPLTLPVAIYGASATWTGNALYTTCSVSGTNPGKLTLACVGSASTLTSTGSTVSFAPPNIQTPILPDLSYSYAQSGTAMSGRLERLSDGSYLVHVTKYSAPGPQASVVVETGADNTANLQ